MIYVILHKNTAREKMRNGRGNNQQKGQHRRMYEMTGVPGWIRFGGSPGFAGGGRGMGPCATYLQKTGQMEKFMEDYMAGNPSAKYWQEAYQDIQQRNPNFEKEMISDQIEELEAEIKALKQRLKQLR